MIGHLKSFIVHFNQFILIVITHHRLLQKNVYFIFSVSIQLKRHTKFNINKNPVYLILSIGLVYNKSINVQL